MGKYGVYLRMLSHRLTFRGAEIYYIGGCGMSLDSVSWTIWRNFLICQKKTEGSNGNYVSWCDCLSMTLSTGIAFGRPYYGYIICIMEDHPLKKWHICVGLVHIAKILAWFQWLFAYDTCLSELLVLKNENKVLTLHNW